MRDGERGIISLRLCHLTMAGIGLSRGRMALSMVMALFLLGADGGIM